MIFRLHSFVTGFFAFITAALFALAPASANPASGGYQLFEPVALEHQHAIQLASLGNFDYFARIASECCNATNSVRTDFVDGVTVTDIRTGQTFTGTVDLRPTLNRIDNGNPHPHRNDGSTFRNNEGLLPSQPDGYYTEFVHPTPGINGPGPQRIIQGQGGELYYTSDHYGSFVPLN